MRQNNIFTILIAIVLLSQTNLFARKESKIIAKAKEAMVFNLIRENKVNALEDLWPFDLEIKEPQLNVTPLQFALTNFDKAEGDIDKESRAEIIIWLIEQGANVHVVDPRTGKTFLHLIAELLKTHFYNLQVFKRLFRIFKLLVAKGVNPDLEDKKGRTFLKYVQDNGISSENLEKMLESEVARKKT